MFSNRRGSKLFRSSADQLEIKNIRCFRPRSRHVARRITDESNFLTPYRSPLLLNGENIAQNLTRMLVVCEGIDRWNFRKLSKLLNIPLSKGPNHRPMHHPTHHPSRIPNQLPPPQLNFSRTQKTRHPAQLPYRNLKRNPRPRRSFGEDQGPNLSDQRTFR